jgi:hypothetical protein
MCICVIFQFKTGVKLKWGCVETLVQINIWWLGKTVESRLEIFLAVKEFSVVSTEITDENYFQ